MATAHSPLLVVLLLATLATFAAPEQGAADPDCAPVTSARRAVIKVIDGDTLLLDDGSEAALIGALSPTPPGGGGDWQDWPPARAARQALETLALGKSVELAFADRQTDRHGRLLAQLFVGDGASRTWLQGALVEAGHARVHASPQTRLCVAALLARETAARQAGRGLWQNAAYAIREAWRTRELMRELQRFQIVEGEVLEVADRRRTVYINFGRHWREDFTVLVERRGRDLFDKAGIDLSQLKGRRIRVRGWLEENGGPLIKVTYPEQIESLDLPAAADATP